MISPEILQQLVPDRDPEDDYPRPPRLLDLDRGAPEWRLGHWSAYLRFRLREEANEDANLDKLIRTSGFIGTGVRRVLGAYESDGVDGFPIVGGYQFSAILFRGLSTERTDAGHHDTALLSLERGRLRTPLIQAVAEFNPHSGQPDGYVAAVYKGEDSKDFGLTAGHVVQRFHPGQRIPIECRDCSAPARLAARPPGLIDAAKVEFTCGGPLCYTLATPRVRHAVEGEVVNLNLGRTGRKQATVMMSLSSASEIKSAAMPMHFLTDDYGFFGDSGSLVSEDCGDDDSADLIGIYLGDSRCQAPNGVVAVYGYALDLSQAADMFGAFGLRGVFHD